MVTIQPELMTPGLGPPSAPARHVSVTWAWHNVYRGPGSVHHQCLDCWGRSGGKLGDKLKFHSDNFPLKIWEFIENLSCLSFHHYTWHDYITMLYLASMEYGPISLLLLSWVDEESTVGIQPGTGISPGSITKPEDKTIWAYLYMKLN